MRKATLIIGFLFLSMSLSNLAKADFAKGLEAANKGDYEAALKEWLIDANQGHVEAQANLGVLYANGIGVTENDVEAVKWYSLAANQGDAYAQSSLGSMYAKGEGVPENDVFAYMWVNLAAATGFEDAKTIKGILAKRMSKKQIAAAQRLSAKWLEEHQ